MDSPSGCKQVTGNDGTAENKYREESDETPSEDPDAKQKGKGKGKKGRRNTKNSPKRKKPAVPAFADGFIPTQHQQPPMIDTMHVRPGVTLETDGQSKNSGHLWRSPMNKAHKQSTEHAQNSPYPKNLFPCIHPMMKKFNYLLEYVFIQ